MDLVCSRKWLVSCTQASFMLGRMLGAGLYGYLSDRFGRRPTLMIAISLTLSFSTSLCWVTNIYLFVLIRFLIGIHATGEFQIAFVIATENAGPLYRPHTGTIGQFTWSVGLVVLAGVAYLIRERFWLQISLSFPLSFLLLLFIFVPESPRYLLSVGKKSQCIKHLKHMAKINKVKFPEEVENQLKADSKIKNFTLFNLFQYPNIRRTTLFLMTSWFTGSFVYYELSLNAAAVSGNPYWNFLLNGLLEIPAYALAIPLLTKFGRISPISGCYFVAGVCIMIGMFVPDGIPIVLIIFSTFGRGAITCGFAMNYIITTELYPTKMRSTGFGTCIILARLAATLAPFTSDLIAIWKYFPFVLSSSIAFTSCLLIQFLPNSPDQPLPQTIEEGEFVNSTGRKCLCERNKKKKTRVTLIMDDNQSRRQL